MRFARIKTKLQRVTTYVSFATFAIVLYSLIRDLYASPYIPWKPEFPIFLLTALMIVGVTLFILAEIDFNHVLSSEMGVQHNKDPMFFSIALRDASTLALWFNDDIEIESAYRIMYRSVGREQAWETALELVRKHRFEPTEPPESLYR